MSSQENQVVEKGKLFERPKDIVGQAEFSPIYYYFQVAYPQTDWSDSQVLSTRDIVEQIDNHLPIKMDEGKGSLVFNASDPKGEGWEAKVQLGGGKPCNILKLGNNPYLHIRVRWGKYDPNCKFYIKICDANVDDAYDKKNNVALIDLNRYMEANTEWQDVLIPASDILDVCPTFNFTRMWLFYIGATGSYSRATLYMEKIRFIVNPKEADKFKQIVKVNQYGYLNAGPKTAMVSFPKDLIPVTPTWFRVVEAKTGKTAFKGSLKRVKAVFETYDQSGDKVYQADFTDLNKPGDYYVEAPEISERSYTFTIGGDVYNKSFRDLCRFFYYARSGPEISEPYAEGYPRRAFYASDTKASFVDDSGTVDVYGGLFDAGDLHKDVNAQANTVWFILETLRAHKDKVPAGSLNLPESDGKLSDLYYIAKWSLDWIQKMWRSDGSVLFWVNMDEGYRFPGYDNSTVSGIGTNATAISAALFSKAYLIFKDIPEFKGYADEMLRKAKISFAWLKEHPENNNAAGPDGTPYGYEYDAATDKLARAYAAIELFNATGDKQYNDYFTNGFVDGLHDYGAKNSYGDVLLDFNWSRINMGYMDYIESARPGADKAIQEKLKKLFIAQADKILENITLTPYKVPAIDFSQMNWGSSGAMCGNGYTLISAYNWTKDAKYRDAALAIIDWVGGRNPVGWSFITGNGSQSASLYSFYYTDLRLQPPGYLTGNINHSAGSSLGQVIKDPWKRFQNVFDAPITEPGIYWNAQAIYLFGYFATTIDK